MWHKIVGRCFLGIADRQLQKENVTVSLDDLVQEKSFIENKLREMFTTANQLYDRT